MVLLLQFLLNGIVRGSAYTLVALGVTLLFSIMHIVNFAHGELYMFGAYICWVFMTYIIGNHWLGMIVAMIVVFFMGLVIEKLAFTTSLKIMRC